MNIVCATTAFNAYHETPSVLVLPERTSLENLADAQSRWPNAIIVGAIAEGCHIRGYAYHLGKNRIDYLKYCSDGESVGVGEAVRTQTYEIEDLIVGVLICRDFRDSPLREPLLHRLAQSHARMKVVCLPSDMDSSWFPSHELREFPGCYVAMSNNARDVTSTRRESFIAGPNGQYLITQSNHDTIATVAP